MTPEELLKPRYKVIFDYPKCPFSIGQILMQDMNTAGEVFILESEVGERFNSNWIDKDIVPNYPHLFKELFWYEDRKSEDMPEFIRDNTSKPMKYLKIDKWHIVDDFIGGQEYWASYNKGSHFMNMWAFQPATKEEYESQNTPENNLNPTYDK